MTVTPRDPSRGPLTNASRTVTVPHSKASRRVTRGP